MSTQGSPPDLARPLLRPRDFAGRLVAVEARSDPAQDRRQIPDRLANLDRRLRESPAGRFDPRGCKREGCQRELKLEGELPTRRGECSISGMVGDWWHRGGEFPEPDDS